MRIAVVGLGFMGAVHLKALESVQEATLAAVVSSDPRKRSGDLSGIAGNLGGPGERMDFSSVRQYASVAEAIADPDIDALDLCTPTHLHVQDAVAALEAGKHVLVEKPMARNGEECDRMIAAARASKRMLMVAQVIRFWPEYQAVRKLIETGKLGEIRSALFRRRCAAPGWQRWVYDAGLSGGGVFDLLIHDIDYCLHTFGVPASISAVGHEDLERGIDTLTANLFYLGKAPVTVTGGWHHPSAYPFSMEFTITGDEGTAEFATYGRPLTLYTAKGAEEKIEVATHDGYQEEIRHFLRAAATGQPSAVCPATESAEAVRLTLALAAARRDQGQIAAYSS